MHGFANRGGGVCKETGAISVFHRKAVEAAGDIEQVNTGFLKLFAGIHRVVNGRAALGVVARAETQGNEVIRAHGFAHRADDVQKQVNAPVEVAAVSIRALVAEWGVELVKEIPVCRMNFYAVKPGFFYARRGFGKLFCKAAKSNAFPLFALRRRHGAFAQQRAFRFCVHTPAVP